MLGDRQDHVIVLSAPRRCRGSRRRHLVCPAAALLLGMAWTVLLAGTWGINVPLAGASPSSISSGGSGSVTPDPDLGYLLLLRSSGGTSINRFAEAMTLFAVSCAGISLIHMGRPWFGYWMFPIRIPWPSGADAESPGLGRLRRLDLRHGLSPLLVRRADPGLATLRDRAKARS